MTCFACQSRDRSEIADYLRNGGKQFCDDHNEVLANNWKEWKYGIYEENDYGGKDYFNEYYEQFDDTDDYFAYLMDSEYPDDTDTTTEEEDSEEELGPKACRD
jgi:hypothetical protein